MVSSPLVMLISLVFILSVPLCSNYHDKSINIPIIITIIAIIIINIIIICNSLIK